MEPNTPQGVDMNLIREALARRREGGGMQGGGNSQMINQVSQPGAANPNTGQPNTPTTPAPQVPQAQVPPQGAAPNVAATMRKAAGQGARLGQAAQGANFDDETKHIAKTLVSKLISYL